MTIADLLASGVRRKRDSFVKKLAVVLIPALLVGCAGTGTTASTGTTESPTVSPTADEAPVDDGATNGSGTSEPSSGEPITIGVMMPQTGPFAGLGVTAQIGALAAIDEINETGGVGGRMLVASVCDDESDTAKNVACMNRFVEEGVAAVVGPLTTPQSLAVSPIAAEEGVITMAHGTGMILTNPINPYLFRVVPSIETIVHFYMDWVLDQGYQRAAILADSSPYGQDVTRIQSEILEEAGVEIVATEQYDVGDTDLSSQLTRIRAANPDVILHDATVQGAAVAARNRVALGLDSIPMIGATGFQNDAFIGLAGEAGDGLILGGWKIAVIDEIDNSDVLYSAIQDYISAWPGDVDRRPDPFGALAWDAVHALAAAFANSDPEDAESVAAALERMDALVGATGIYKWGPDDHDGGSADGLVMSTLTEGKWKLLR